MRNAWPNYAERWCPNMATHRRVNPACNHFEYTRMQNPPLIRAECACGWWTDEKQMRTAVLKMKMHRSSMCQECLLWVQRVDPSVYPSQNHYQAALKMWHRNGHRLPK